MYQLYACPGSCSMAVHIALNECNQPVTLHTISLQEGQNRSPEFLKINPRGQVPVLLDGDQVLREGAAMMVHILEKHHSPLLPSSGKERDLALEWLMFANATLHPAYSRVFFLMKNPVDPAATDKLQSVAVEQINRLWAEIEERLGQSAYLAGDQITIADILVTVIANWSARMPKPIQLGARTKKLFQTVIARPAYKKALEVEQVAYVVAA